MNSSFSAYTDDFELKNLLSENSVDWNQVYAKYYYQFTEYIGQLVLRSDYNIVARQLVQHLRDIFTWREEYWLIWEIDGTVSTTFGEFRYPSLSALMERIQDSSRPCEDPQSIVGLAANGCDWGDYRCCSVRIYDLKMS